MGGETSRVVLRLTKDPRLIAAVSAAAAHFAARAHMDFNETEDWVVASEETCREALPLLSKPDATLQVTIEHFPDRIEMTLCPASASKAATTGRADLRALVDRVEVRAEPGTPRMTLIKYIPPRAEKT